MRHLLRPRICDEATLIKQQHPIGMGKSEIEVMQYEENAEPALTSFLVQQSHEGSLLPNIEIGGRLVCKQHGRMCRQRAREHYA